MTGAQAEITISLDLRSEDFSGAVRSDGGDERRFVGWLGLIDALQRAADEARRASPISAETRRS